MSSAFKILQRDLACWQLRISWAGVAAAADWTPWRAAPSRVSRSHAVIAGTLSGLGELLQNAARDLVATAHTPDRAQAGPGREGPALFGPEAVNDPERTGFPAHLNP
jgi:hypothetical protein